MHSLRQIGAYRFHQKMVVVRHQAEGMDFQVMVFHCFGQRIEPNQVVAPVMINGCATIST